MVWRVALRFVALTHEAAEGNQFIASATCTKGNTRIALNPQMRFCHSYSSVEPRTHFMVESTRAACLALASAPRPRMTLPAPVPRPQWAALARISFSRCATSGASSMLVWVRSKPYTRKASRWASARS